MKCPYCNEPIVGLTFVLLGQEMCPNCGTIIDIENMIEKGEDMENEKQAEEN